MQTPSIPVTFILDLVDKLLAIAKEMPEGPMRRMMAVRAEYYLDLVKEWQESERNEVNRHR